MLTLEESGSVLERSTAEVVRAIDAGFLRALRRGSQVFVTPSACSEFLREKRRTGLSRVIGGASPPSPP